MAKLKSYPLRQRLPSVGELSAKQTERLYKGQPANYTKASPGFFPRTLAFYYTTKHHSGVVMSDSTVEMAVHLLAKVESAPYFSARPGQRWVRLPSGIF